MTSPVTLEDLETPAVSFLELLLPQERATSRGNQGRRRSLDAEMSALSNGRESALRWLLRHNPKCRISLVSLAGRLDKAS